MISTRSLLPKALQGGNTMIEIIWIVDELDYDPNHGIRDKHACISDMQLALDVYKSRRKVDFEAAKGDYRYPKHSTALSLRLKYTDEKEDRQTAIREISRISQEMKKMGYTQTCGPIWRGNHYWHDGHCDVFFTNEFSLWENDSHK